MYIYINFCSCSSIYTLTIHIYIYTTVHIWKKLALIDHIFPRIPNYLRIIFSCLSIRISPKFFIDDLLKRLPILIKTYSYIFSFEMSWILTLVSFLFFSFFFCISFFTNSQFPAFPCFLIPYSYHIHICQKAGE